MYVYLYIYICVCVCSHLISPCCSPCWWVFLRFSISSPGDFISFPHLFDHFIKRIWSVIQIYLISLSHKKTCFPPICSLYRLVSSAVPSFPHLFLQLIITVCLQFSKVFPTYWCMLSLGFISFSHLFLEFIMMSHEFFWLSVPSLFFRFHQSSSPKSSLYHSFSSVFSQLLVTRFYLFSPSTCSFYHWRSSFSPSIPWFYHEISISFPHLFVHLLTRFRQFSPHPGSFNHWFLLGFSISSFYPWISSCSRPIAMCVLCIIFI